MVYICGPDGEDTEDQKPSSISHVCQCSLHGGPGVEWKWMQGVPGFARSVDGSPRWPRGRQPTEPPRVHAQSSVRDGARAQLEVRRADGALERVAESEACLANERDDGVDDLVKSDFLHEPGILHTLNVRYGLDSIYIYSGQILIAVNPHKRLRGLYGARTMGNYRGAALGDLSPHVYAIAEQVTVLVWLLERGWGVLVGLVGWSGLDALHDRGRALAVIPHCQRHGAVLGHG